jgi:hypothetical protein
MLQLPRVSRMSLAAADDFLHTHFPALADSVADYERSGNSHLYFMEDGSVVRVNKFRVVRLDQDGKEVERLASFIQ